MKWIFARAAATALLLLAMTGCDLKNTKPVAPAPSYVQLMTQAEARITAQDAAGAKALFRKAAKADPTRKEPWYRVAQLGFNEQSYGKAIVDSQEVLQRDPGDMDAENILTVAGLRVAMDALGRLHDEADQQGPAHQEAEKLAKKMRETLGQDVLVPPAAKHHRRTHRHRPAQKAKATAPAPSAKPANSNPFQALPGSG